MSEAWVNGFVATNRSHSLSFGQGEIDVFDRRLGLTDGAAADVVLESFLRLCDALRAGQSIRDLNAWTFHVACRLAMDERRRFARRLRLNKIRNHHTASGDLADDHERQQVWSEVDRLPERQRAVLYLRFRADLAFEDIGATLGITASAARSCHVPLRQQ